jgi:hypothetical protein
MEMAFKGTLRRAARLLLILLFASGMIVAASTAAPQRALAAACTVQTYGTLLIDGQYVTQVIASPLAGTCASRVIAHDCITMGGNGGVSAIECVDIYMTWNSSAIEVWGEGEYYCQSSAGYAQCASMSVDQVFYWDANTGSQQAYGHPGGNYTCSGSGCPNGASTTTGRAWVNTYHYSGSQSPAAAECTVPIIAKAEASNSIIVPDGDKITDPKVASTPLISVCFGG